MNAKVTMCNTTWIKKENCIYLFDACMEKGSDYAHFVGARTILVSSPCESNHKNLQNGTKATVLYMPAWSMNEATIKPVQI